jgi:tryptophanyl-tRNA synthetase
VRRLYAFFCWYRKAGAVAVLGALRSQYALYQTRMASKEGPTISSLAVVADEATESVYELAAYCHAVETGRVVARDIAGAFHRAYGEDFFPLPEPMIMPTAARVMSLTDGTKKMSKSDPSDYSRITLTDDADAIAQKIRKAQTDAIEGIAYDPENRPSVANLLTIYAALTDTTPQVVAEQFATAQASAFKQALLDVAVSKLSPITTRMRELLADTAELDAILKRGAERANEVSAPILKETQKLVGFLQL